MLSEELRRKENQLIKLLWSAYQQPCCLWAPAPCSMHDFLSILLVLLSPEQPHFWLQQCLRHANGRTFSSFKPQFTALFLPFFGCLGRLNFASAMLAVIWGICSNLGDDSSLGGGVRVTYINHEKDVGTQEIKTSNMDEHTLDYQWCPSSTCWVPPMTAESREHRWGGWATDLHWDPI